MKNFIVLMTLLASSQSFAGQACGAFYAAGIGHVLKGEGVAVGDKEKILEGETSADTHYKVTVKKGVPQLTEAQTGAAVKMTAKEVMPGMQMYATQTLKLYPTGVPGTFAENRFIIMMCADENSF
jgi:hypothetical protein